MSVKYALLALLYQRPMHGYEMGKQLTLTINAEWDVKPGQIASTLTRLHDAQLVEYEVTEGDDGPDRKIYRLTDAGLDDLRTWFLTPEVREYKLGDAFYVKLVLSLIGSPVSPEQVLSAQRRELFQQLHQITEMRRKANVHTELPWVLLLESATMHLEADLRWIEMLEARMDELVRYSPPRPEPKPRGRPRKNAEVQSIAPTSEPELPPNAK